MDFSSNGVQDLLVIEKREEKEKAYKRYEVPFVEDFIEKIDFKEKKIFMNLPEGLIPL